MLLLILIILLILAFGGGAWGYPSYRGWAWSPFVLILIVLLALWAIGAVRF